MKPKSLIILLSLLCILSAKSFAQVSFGGGYQLYHYNTPDIEAYQGFYGGFSYNLKLWTVFSFEPGLYYSYVSRDLKANSTLPGLSEASALEHSLVLPLHLRLNIPIAKGVGIVLFGGPRFNYDIGEKLNFSLDNPDSQEGLPFSFNYDYIKGSFEGDEVYDSVRSSLVSELGLNTSKRAGIAVSGGVGVLLGQMCLLKISYLHGLTDHSTDGTKLQGVDAGVSFFF